MRIVWLGVRGHKQIFIIPEKYVRLSVEHFNGQHILRRISVVANGIKDTVLAPKVGDTTFRRYPGTAKEYYPAARFDHSG